MELRRRSSSSLFVRLDDEYWLLLCRRLRVCSSLFGRRRARWARRLLDLVLCEKLLVWSQWRRIFLFVFDT